MRWYNGRRIDVRRIIDEKNLYERTLVNNRALMDGFGTPCTYWKNTAFNEHGERLPIEEGNKCYCWSTQDSQPDARHLLCLGTGILSAYQKYGYKEITLAAPSKYAKVGTGIIPYLINEKPAALTWSTSTSGSSDLESNEIVLDDFF